MRVEEEEEEKEKEEKEEQLGTCFVCFEDDAPKATCGCITAHVHSECLLKSLVSTGKTHCPICLKRYSNVRVDSVVTRRCNPTYYQSGLFFVCSAVLLLCPSIVMYSAPPNMAATVGAAVFYVVAFQVFMCGCLIAGQAVHRRLPLCLNETHFVKVVIPDSSLEMRIDVPAAPSS